MKTTSQIIKQEILNAAEKDYKEFSASLIPNINNVIGVRIPTLRQIAREVFKKYGEQCLIPYKTEFMEEIMIRGMIIGLLKKEADDVLDYVKNFVPQINNWAVCDIFCGSLKFTIKNKEKVWKFIQPYLKSQKEYEIRFGLVMLLSYFIETDYLEKIFIILDNFKHDGYYAKMGAAWLLSMCYVKYPKETEIYLKKSKLDDWTYNKGIQKTCESLRIDKATKQRLKIMKRK